MSKMKWRIEIFMMIFCNDYRIRIIEYDKYIEHFIIDININND